MKLFVWTEAYRPFIMGGDVHALIGAEVEAGEPIDIGRKITVHVVVNPRNGQTHIACANADGAFVGTDLEEVKHDLKTAKPAVVRKQIADALERRKTKVVHIDAEEFWKTFRS